MPRKSFYKQTSKVEAASTATVLEVEKPSKFVKVEELEIKPIPRRARWGWWFFSTFLILLITVIAILGATGWWYIRSFEHASGVQLLPLLKTIYEKRQENVFAERTYKTFLLLGLDQSQNQREESLLTDTMMMAIVHQDGKIGIISLPRDLWIESLKTKINALYYYGQQTNSEDGVALVTSVITEITGIPVDYYFLVNMDTVKSLIDALGGIDVKVERAFVDPQYPREIDLTSNDPSVLYETIAFNAGYQHMNGETSLKFIRSRHSPDELEGTDEGRERRQQVMLSALKQELFSPTTVSNPTILGNLYKVWKTSVKTNCSEVDLALIGKNINRSTLSISSDTVPISNDVSEGLLYHPKKGPANQWVYVPYDPSWKALREWFQRFTK